MRNKALAIIVLIAAFLRFYSLATVPASLSEKEAALGYKFYTIFGVVLNEFWVRFPAAAVGVISVVVMYFTALQVTKSKSAAMLSSFLLAISAWYVHLSRTDISTSLIILLFVFQVFLLHLKSRNKLIFAAVVVNQILMCLVHPVGWVLSLVTIYWIFRNLKVIGINLLIFALSIFAIVLFLTKESFQNFYLKNAFYNEIGFVNHINKNRGEVNESSYKFIKFPAVQNKATAFIDQIIKNYIRSFDFYYFVLQDNSKEKQTVYEFGKFYAIELLFFFLGIYFLIKRKLNKDYLLIALLTIPLGGMLSLMPNFNQVMFTWAVPFYIITAFGAVSFLQQLKTLIFPFSFLVLVLLSFTFFHFYFKIYPQLSYKEWNFGYKQITEKVKNVEGYNKVIISDRISTTPKVYFDFYRSNNLKLNFRGIGTDQKDFEKGNLLVVSEEEMRINQIVDCLEKEKCYLIDKVTGPDGKTIFSFIEFI